MLTVDDGASDGDGNATTAGGGDWLLGASGARGIGLPYVYPGLDDGAVDGRGWPGCWEGWPGTGVTVSRAWMLWLRATTEVAAVREALVMMGLVSPRTILEC